MQFARRERCLPAFSLSIPSRDLLRFFRPGRRERRRPGRGRNPEADLPDEGPGDRSGGPRAGSPPGARWPRGRPASAAGQGRRAAAPGGCGGSRLPGHGGRWSGRRPVAGTCRAFRRGASFPELRGEGPLPERLDAGDARIHAPHPACEERAPELRVRLLEARIRLPSDEEAPRLGWTGVSGRVEQVGHPVHGDDARGVEPGQVLQAEGEALHEGAGRFAPGLDESGSYRRHAAPPDGWSAASGDAVGVTTTATDQRSWRSRARALALLLAPRWRGAGDGTGLDLAGRVTGVEAARCEPSAVGRRPPYMQALATTARADDQMAA